jgi:hypothetical protein
VSGVGLTAIRVRFDLSFKQIFMMYLV